MNSVYANFLTMLSSEFDRYVMDHQSFADEIPRNAIIIFQVQGEDGFNAWHRNISLKNREAEQPLVYVHIHKWRVQSLLEEVTLAHST
jgi:hypothetical protein